jgi:ABC-type multidrug transport system fused ATPase/permease subunit
MDRILNRFSDDQDSVDSQVPVAIGSLFAMIFSVGGGVLTVFVITQYFGLCLLPIAYLYFWYMTRFLSAAREIQRYQSISKSPLLSNVSESIEGLSVIRSLGIRSIEYIHATHESFLDSYLRVSMTVALGSAWFSLRIQLLGSFFVLIISLVLFVSYYSSSSSSSVEGQDELLLGGPHDVGSSTSVSISSNMIALALSYTLSISDDFMSFVMICSWCEQSMISPERILQYIHIPPEGGEQNQRLFRADAEEEEGLNSHHGQSSLSLFLKESLAAEEVELDSAAASEATVRLLEPNTPTTPQTQPQVWSSLFSSSSSLATPATAPHSHGLTLPHNSWPTEGVIEFCNVYFKYQPTSQETILSDLTFRTTRHEKIGIVGRTGAGKSSLTMSLFRIAELSSGKILIDGVDISHVTLHTLRNAITIIPQAPVLFRGSLRSYLDPFREYSEEHLWRILKKTHVADLIQQMMTPPSPSPATTSAPAPAPPLRSIAQYLEFELAENGENFSIGQRQLLVLSRALLKDVRILIMDEATASMDRETDHRIQQILREEFHAATVLTIAHRIETIIDCDRILVLSAGMPPPPPAPSSPSP